MSLYDTSNPLQKEQFKARSAKLAESGKVVELTEKKPKRSLQSNKYLHVILGYCACETGNTLEWALTCSTAFSTVVLEVGGNG